MQFYSDCLTCGYRSMDPSRCPLLGVEYKQDQTCPYHACEIPVCEVCRNIIVSTKPLRFYQFPDTYWKPVCENCVSAIGTCRNCSNSTACDFETNPSPLPKAVIKSFQQGNMITQTTVKNEERVAITCAQNCGCFDHETSTCLREYGTCANYKGVF